MIKKIEGFLFNKFAGKIIARGVVTLAAWLVAQAGGVGVGLNQSEIELALTMGAHAAYEWVKAKRMKAPAASAEPAPKA